MDFDDLVFNDTLVYVIKSSNNSKFDLVPVGTLQFFKLDFHMGQCLKNGGWLICDGSRLKCEDYPDLYNVLRDEYCPKYIKIDNKFKKFLRKLGINIKPKEVLNPEYIENEFRIPDLTGDFFLGKDDQNIEEKIIRE